MKRFAKDARAPGRRFEVAAWGVIFIWLGVSPLTPGLASGTHALGFGVILLGLNLARYASRIEINRLTVCLGAAAVALGGTLCLLHLALGLERARLPFFPTLLIGLGVFCLVRSAARVRSRPDTID
jgi:hypothetical protein